MNSRSIKAKGRRLQTTVAVMLAQQYDLTIEAVPPTKTGHRDGVTWVPEGARPQADLKVRRMGEAGPDVVLLSNEAQNKVAINSWPVCFECKNAEAWAFDARFWWWGKSAFVDSAFDQMLKTGIKTGKWSAWLPVLILGKNRWPPLAVWRREGLGAPRTRVYGPILTFEGITVMRFTDFMKYLDGEVAHGR